MVRSSMHAFLQHAASHFSAPVFGARWYTWSICLTGWLHSDCGSPAASIRCNHTVRTVIAESFPTEEDQLGDNSAGLPRKQHITAAETRH